MYLNVECVKLTLTQLRRCIALSVHVREIDIVVQESAVSLKRLGIILTCLRARGAPSRGLLLPFYFLLFPRGNTRTVSLLFLPCCQQEREISSWPTSIQ